MDKVLLKFNIIPNNLQSPFAVKVYLDDECVYSTQQVNEAIYFSHEFVDLEGDRLLSIELSGKTSDHTKIDEQGNRISDSMLEITQMSVDDIDINHLFLSKCVYTHDFNGTQPEIEDTFWGLAGCNGTINFKFSTPIYMWLLENM